MLPMPEDFSRFFANLLYEIGENQTFQHFFHTINYYTKLVNTEIKLELSYAPLSTL